MKIGLSEVPSVHLTRPVEAVYVSKLLDGSVGTVYLQKAEFSPTMRVIVPSPRAVQVVGKLGLQAEGAYWTVLLHPHPPHPLPYPLPELLHPQAIVF